MLPNTSLNYSSEKKEVKLLARMSINCEWKKSQTKSVTPGPPVYKLWMEKQKNVSNDALLNYVMTWS